MISIKLYMVSVRDNYSNKVLFMQKSLTKKEALELTGKLMDYYDDGVTIEITQCVSNAYAMVGAQENPPENKESNSIKVPDYKLPTYKVPGSIKTDKVPAYN